MSKLRFDVVSLFQEAFINFFNHGLIKKAFEEKIASIHIHNPRDHSIDNYRKVDDEPYGGGAGMVLKPEPYFSVFDQIPKLNKKRILLMTPQGRKISQSDFSRWSKEDQLILICGSYEGFDERIRSLVDEEISKRGILANKTLRNIEFEISLGLNPGLKATITLQLSKI